MHITEHLQPKTNLFAFHSASLLQKFDELGNQGRIGVAKTNLGFTCLRSFAPVKTKPHAHQLGPGKRFWLFYLERVTIWIVLNVARITPGSTGYVMLLHPIHHG